MHCFEGPDWVYLKRGRESFSRGPYVKSDPLGRCAGGLVYDLQMIILKSAQVFPFKPALLKLILKVFANIPSINLLNRNLLMHQAGAAFSKLSLSNHASKAVKNIQTISICLIVDFKRPIAINCYWQASISTIFIFLCCFFL